MSSENLITVYIVNHNYGKYILKSINSVLQQSYKNFELIIIDDFSSDNSKSIIDKFNNHKKVRIIYNKKKFGLIKSANISIKASKGEYIFRLDADDFLHKNALQILLNEIIKKRDIALVYSDYYNVDEKNAVLSLNKQFFVGSKKYLNQKVPHGACSLIRKNILFDVGLYDENLDRQDGYDIWYKISNLYKIVHVDLPLFFYRQHSLSLSKNKSKLFKIRSKILKKNIKKIKIPENIVAVIPVRGPNISNDCDSLYKFKGKELLKILINKVLKIKLIKNIVVLSSDKNVLNLVKKYKDKKIKFFKRDIKDSLENTSQKKSILKYFDNYKIKPNLLFTLNFNYPFLDNFYYDLSINTLLIHDYNKVITVLPDIKNQFYKDSNTGLKLISNSNSKQLKLERDIIYVEKGGIQLETYKSFLSNSQNKKKGKIVIDNQSSIKIGKK